MSHGPTAALDTTDSRIVELDDGFLRLGDEDTPYTLVGGQEKRELAAAIHAKRRASDRQTDEKTNEPVTRDRETWEGDLWRYDYPFVDTVPHDDQLRRAERVADLARELGYVETITHGVDFSDPRRRGRFWSNPNEIETRADPGDFLGFRKGPALAHELGHAFYRGIGLDGSFYGEPRLVFRTDEQEREAHNLSIRLRGPFAEAPPGFVDYRERQPELFADVFAAAVIEPAAARRVGPTAIARVESALDEAPHRSPLEVL